MFVSTLVLLGVLAGAPDVEEPALEAVRESAQRTVAYVEDRGVWWIEEKDCVSCHRVGNMVWSLRAAQARGLDVSERLDEWTEWSLEQSLDKNDKGDFVASGNREGVVQLLASLPLASNTPEQKESARRLLELIADGQQEDGRWKPGGQLPMQKRPADETAAVSTLWIAWSLASADGSPAEFTTQVGRAWEFAERAAPGKSVEWYAGRLLLALARDDGDSAQHSLGKLRELQHDDGGWGWLVADPSDALGTGLALFALAKAGVEPRDPVVLRAQQFLLATQQADGSWPVNGTKEKKKNQIAETARYWGATWALLGLVSTLPEESRVGQPTQQANGE